MARMNETGSGRVEALPWPAPWPKPKRAGGLVTVLFGAALAVGGVAAGVQLLLPGPVDPRGFIVVAIIPLACGLALAAGAQRMGIRSRSTRAVRSVDIEDACRRALGQDGWGKALSFPLLRSLWVGQWLLIWGGLLIGALLLAVSWLVAFASSPLNVTALIYGSVMLLAALPLAALVIEKLRGKALRGELAISAQGIRYRMLSYDVWMEWAALQSVSIVGGDSLRIVLMGYANMPPSVQGRSRLLGVSKAVFAQAAEATVAIKGVSLSVDPALAFHTLRYYHANPEARTELGTDAAVRRVRAGAVLTA
jgi:hypothetical protein